MYHFFVSPEAVADGTVTITGNDVNHIRSVLRMKPGEGLTVNDGTHDYVCRLSSLQKEFVTAEIIKISGCDSELPARIYLFQGLPKSDKLELIIQKCIELGAHAIVPVMMKRCVVKLDSKKEEARLKRWSAIAESAAKQSKRGLIPEIFPVMSYDKAIDMASKMNHILIPYEKAENMDVTREAMRKVRPGDELALFVGPEGGFEESEIALAESKGAKAITLGKRILRTETAGMAAIAMLTYEIES